MIFNHQWKVQRRAEPLSVHDYEGENMLLIITLAKRKSISEGNANIKTTCGTQRANEI